MAGTAAVEAGQDVPLFVQNADPSLRPFDRSLADVEHSVLVHGDVHGTLDVVPGRFVLALSRKDL